MASPITLERSIPHLRLTAKALGRKKRTISWTRSQAKLQGSQTFTFPTILKVVCDGIMTSLKWTPEMLPCLFLPHALRRRLIGRSHLLVRTLNRLLRKVGRKRLHHLYILFKPLSNHAYKMACNNPARLLHL
ncbi:MAG: hypothetical protein BGO25_09305 [Acidobacteriales bacterium 59-55]|nr:MAG: hypothetical protein BGO25_09305 [Acidobacteriales bacterium 59-55]